MTTAKLSLTQADRKGMQSTCRAGYRQTFTGMRVLWR